MQPHRTTLLTRTSQSEAPFIIPRGAMASETQWKTQFAPMYFLRLRTLAPAVNRRAEIKWEKKTYQLPSSSANTAPVSLPVKHVARILDCLIGHLCYITGTIYMEMVLKPNILEDLARASWLAPPETRQKYGSSTDEIILEDESGRVILIGDTIKQAGLVSGIITSVLGVLNSDGEFQVQEMCFAGPGQHPEPRREEENSKGAWVAIASGLGLGNAQAGADMRASMLVEFLLGETGIQHDGISSSNIARLILAGDNMAPPPDPRTQSLTSQTQGKKRYGYDPAMYATSPAEGLDTFLAEILPSIAVTVMPGALDPSPASLPQQPLPRGLLPLSRPWGGGPTQAEDPPDLEGEESDKALHYQQGWEGATNPWSGMIDGKMFLGTSGQNISDIFHYIDGSRLEMACKTWEWRHIAPTCPDTLWCAPFTDRDPFIMTQCPHVYFVGNQPAFESVLKTSDEGQKTRIVMVPRFSETGQIVLVHTESLESRVVSFAVPQSDTDAFEVNNTLVNRSGINGHADESGMADG